MNIYVNVYDLDDGSGSGSTTSTSGAAMLRGMNMGLHHTGVEIGGFEYSFSNAGVSRTQPGLPEFGVFREQLLMGNYPGVLHEIHDVIGRLQTFEGGFGPGQYNVLRRNCNHFSDALCYELLRVHIPDWINRAASVGSSVVGNNGNASNTSSTSSAEKFVAPGVVAPPSLAKRTTSSQAPHTFSGTESGSSWFSGLLSVFSWNSSTETAPPPATDNCRPQAVNPNGSKQLSEKQKRLLSQLKSS
jgi:hypothetical protein